MTSNNSLLSVIDSLSLWRYPMHVKSAPTWCRIQTSMGVAAYQGIKIADKRPSVEVLQERIKLLKVQLEHNIG